jgi:hypothetical protein
MRKSEEMRNGQIKNDSDVAHSSFGLPASFAVRHFCSVISSALILMVVAKVTQAQSPNLIGKWRVDITFGNQEHHSLRFDAQGGGKGTFLMLDPKLNVWGPAKPSEANWNRDEGTSVTFSGPVEFLIGNVGRDAGILVFKGKFETPNLIIGDVDFSPVGWDRPSKHGTFRAVPAGGGEK